MATYTYSLSTDFGGQICLTTLTDEILAESAITTDLTYIVVAPALRSDDVDIVFDSTLSGSEVTALDGVVATHDGSICPEPDALLTVLREHISDATSNPHMITALQVGAAEAVHTHLEADITDLDHDAVKIQGIDVDDADIANGRVLVYNSVSGNLEYEDQSGAAADGTAVTAAALQIRRTTSYTLTSSYVDITFNTTDVETDPSIIEHNNSNTDRIDIKEDGTYLITYGGTGRTQASNDTCRIEGQVTVDDGAAIAGSYALSGTFEDTSIDGAYEAVDDYLSHTFLAELTAGEFITLQFRYQPGADGADILANTASFKVVRLEGLRGDRGPAGAGSTVIIQDEGVDLPNTPHSIINFVGDAVEATDSTGVATITIEGGTFSGSEFQQVSSEGESTTTSGSWQQKLRLTTSNLDSGTYRIGWYCEFTTDDGSEECEVQVELNDTTQLAYVLEEPNPVTAWEILAGFKYESLSGVNTIDIDFANPSAGTSSIRRARLEIWRVS